MKDPNPIQEPTTEQKIEAVRQEIAGLNANDSEFDRIEDIKRRLKNKEITDEEAIRSAYQILNSKQDH